MNRSRLCYPLHHGPLNKKRAINNIKGFHYLILESYIKFKETYSKLDVRLRVLESLFKGKKGEIDKIIL
mgnify:CR=1 FL=1